MLYLCAYRQSTVVGYAPGSARSEAKRIQPIETSQLPIELCCSAHYGDFIVYKPHTKSFTRAYWCWPDTKHPFVLFFFTSFAMQQLHS